MNSPKKALTLVLLAFAIICHAQKPQKDTVGSDGVATTATISDVGMYEGTQSKKAQEYFDKATEYTDQGDFKNAAKQYLKAIKKDPGYVEAYDNLGLIYRRMGAFDIAIEYYKKSIALYPDGPLAHQNLAAVYTIQNNYQAAIDEYKEMLRISPEDPEGYFGLGNTYLRLSRFDEALTPAKKAMELYEKANSHHLGDGYMVVGLIYYYKEEKAQAKTYFQSAKDVGAILHPQLEKELFFQKEESLADIPLNTEEDFANNEQRVIDSFHWLMETPLGTAPAKRKETHAFLMKWMTGSPTVSIDISENIVTYLDCAECLLIYMSGWTAYALETRDFRNREKAALAGTEKVIEFYQANKEALGKNKAIEKLIKLQGENKLKGYIQSNM